ncbi:ABC transporter ATP-binding protein [Listeria fleischmannii 1991]|uniref:Macrolide export ATP-binding/permease protein MacB n=3 Tax=Listeria fleischmannii TaxID=1069827 RepID=A0A2X3HAL8_9LIST|nr:ABC transporter ATP-binding protein [Listeria fleischmannii subsp. fleischmannii LU2006-1]KMT57709.1 ABC transporter ATP-binding protein [Listeria fleischmannii 1991]SQC69557.1 Macrolide export ATP-binding/permease protein MacB [Listeria fleischmannii subsp. fleischmannii]
MLIDLKHISKSYQMGSETLKVLDDITFNVASGEFLTITGQSGSGKSTLLNIIGCLDLPDEGDYYLSGEKLLGISDNKLAAVRNQQLGFIFQQFNLLTNLTVLENVELPLIYRGIKKSERIEKARHFIERVGLGDKVKHLPNQLSGGQQQRVAIARALVGSPSILLADEPTGSLDSKNGWEVLKMLQNINQEGRTIIMITHDKEIADEGSRTLKMQDGKLIQEGSAC